MVWLGMRETCGVLFRLRDRGVRDGVGAAMASVLGILEEREPTDRGPLKAREITVQLGLETASAKVERVRSKARRLAERGWLVQEAPGAFSAGRRPVAVPGDGSSA